ncbi:MAG: aspartate carbamoyltransferase [Candidatus Thermoplasmatota archaeon]|nr:aspartate carbamoyltransferase [Candidatus Thermoplasmatota archaeon]
MLKGKDIVAINDLSQDEIERILNKAREMVPIARAEKKSRLLEGRILASFFFEPSTRTRLSFETAMQRLGGSVITVTGQEGTSIIKGETLADTVRMAECFSDIIVLRHPREGAARLAAGFSNIPVINGGDGAGQHPTQTLLDLFTIKEEFNDISKLHVTIAGDLKYGRTTHSLSVALSRMGASLSFVAPPTIQMPDHILDEISGMGADHELSSDLMGCIPKTDVLYMTRIQKERFPDFEEYIKVAGAFRLDLDMLENAKKGMIVMHPLPRVDEVHPDIDPTEHARYFQQAFNGVPVRMALLSLILEGDI